MKRRIVMRSKSLFLIGVMLFTTMAPNAISDVKAANAVKTAKATTEEVSVELFQNGDFAETSLVEKLEGSRNYGEVKAAIKADLDEVKETTNLKKFNLNKEEVEAIYCDVVNENPELFYAENEIVLTQEDGVVTKVAYQYSEEKEAVGAEKTAYQNTLETIVAMVNPDWSDFEKALFVYDYLIANYQYDHALKIYDAQTFFTERKGVCQAYMLAYRAIMCALGIENASVSNSNHTWNQVKIGGKWYHVDCTWGDPYSMVDGQKCDYFSKVSHTNFLKSDDGIRGNGHEGWEDSSYVSCTDTTYDSFFLDNGYYYHLPDSLVSVNGQWYAQIMNIIYRIDFENCQKEVIKTIEGEVKRGSVSDGEQLYYSDGTHVYAYNIAADATTLVLTREEGDIAALGYFEGNLVASTKECNYTKDDIFVLKELNDLSYFTKDAVVYRNGAWGNAIFAGYEGSETSLVIPKQVNEKKVTSVGAGALSENTTLQNLTLPDSVTTLGNRAFYNCTGLKTVVINAAKISIGQEAFYNCKGMDDIEMAGTIVFIGYRAFYNCTGVKYLDLSNLTLGSYFSLQGCKNLEAVKLPDNVKTIPSNMFWSCTSLQSIDIPNSVTTIGINAFLNCTSLATLEIPGNVETIGTSVFALCTGLTHVEIKDGVTEIGKTAFEGCKNLETIKIPDSVTTIGTNAFGSCTKVRFDASEGSYAETYARENKIPLVTDPLFGDTDGDGVVSSTDALMILKYVVGFESFDTDTLFRSDVSGDGVVSAVDALMVLKKVVGLLDKFDVELYN